MLIRLCSFFAITVFLAACGNDSSSTQVAGSSETSPSAAPAKAAPDKPLDAAPVNTDAPSIAEAANGKVRIKLHELQELQPAPNAPGKPEPGKKYYTADVSLEYLQGHNTSPAEYLLTAYIVDDKGEKYGLPMGSVKMALLLSDEEAKKADAAGTLFNTSSPAIGARFRDNHYGVMMPESRKPVAFSIMLDGKEVKVPLQR